MANTSKSLLPQNLNNIIECPTELNKSTRNRLEIYRQWLDDNQSIWYAPNLALYRDYLLTERNLKATSARVHLSTIRSRYHALLEDRALLFSVIDNQIAQGSITVTDFADKQAYVNELALRIEGAVSTRQTKVKVVKAQDVVDSQHLRLTRAQVKELLSKPLLNTAKGKRDAAILALMLATGIRAQELADLTLGDLRQTIEGRLCLWVQDGKGNKARAVPYGNEIWALDYVDLWLKTLERRARRIAT